MSDESAPVSIGDVVAGKYLVDRVLGAGGMGVVVAATHVQLDRKVAIKFLLPSAMKNPDVVQRFSREARAASSLNHPHIAAIHELLETDDGVPVLVLELVEGEALDALLVEAARERTMA